jgi:hypothetical protein
MLLNQKELLLAHTSSLQQALPDEVMFNGRPTILSECEKRACGRAIWYVINRGYGLSSAVERAARAFRCSPSKVKRGIVPLFPPNYFIELEQQKKYILYDKTS